MGQGFSSNPADFVFRQLFDTESSTFTYLLADLKTKEALLIDPVLEQVDRDFSILKELELDLKYIINTHVHADHIVSNNAMRSKHFPNLRSVLGKTGNESAKADLHMDHGAVLKMGTVELQFISTPGHTNGCHTLVEHRRKLVFTGDTVLIRGCGRTDFQQGDAHQLYRSVWERILSLPDEYFIYPAHDYKGRNVSTVWEETLYNPRLTKSEEEFVEIMKNLNLPYPKKMDASVPANMVCGVHEITNGASA